MFSVMVDSALVAVRTETPMSTMDPTAATVSSVST
jgi:hypothetical protein